MLKEDATQAARVVVALNMFRQEAEVLELAARLAAHKQARLLALFVEDADLANLAGLPFAREVCRDSAAERGLDSLRLERGLRVRAARIQALLGRLNQRLSIEVGFKTVRGAFMPKVFEEAGRVDILCLGHKAGRSVHGGAARGAEAMPVWTVYDGSPESAAALALAGEWAGWEGCGLYVALPVGNGGGFQKLAAGASSLCAGRGRTPGLYPLEIGDGAKLLRRMRQTGCRLLVVARRDAGLVERVAEAAAYPLVLV